MFLTDKNFDVPQHIRHGFFGRRGGVSTGIYESLNCAPNSADNPKHIAENRARVAAAMGVAPENLWTLHQIHSADCLIVREPFDSNFDHPKADGLVTDVAGLALGALTADCAPVLFYGEKPDGSPVIGAAHAGWKGAIGGVLEATITKMIEIGAVRSSIRASVGACLGKNSYEVERRFIEYFPEVYVNKYFTPVFPPSYRELLSQKALGRDDAFLGIYNEISNYFHYRKKLAKHEENRKSKYLFDFPAYVVHRLHRAGIQDVSWTGHDTYTNEFDFFSYRRSTHRNEPDYGRQISAIAIL